MIQERTQEQAESLALEQARTFNIILPYNLKYNEWIHFNGKNGEEEPNNKWKKEYKYSYKFSLKNIDYGVDIKGVICKLTTKEKFIINTYEFRSKKL